MNTDILAFNPLYHWAKMLEPWFPRMPEMEAEKAPVPDIVDMMLMRTRATANAQPRRHHILFEDIQDFARLSGDRNKLHLDEEYAKHTHFKGCIAHGMLVASYMSSHISSAYPGALYVFQSLNFTAPVRPGDEVETRLAPTKVEGRRMTLACVWKVKNKVVLHGDAEIYLPKQ